MLYFFLVYTSPNGSTTIYASDYFNIASPSYEITLTLGEYYNYTSTDEIRRTFYRMDDDFFSDSGDYYLHIIVEHDFESNMLLFEP